MTRPPCTRNPYRRPRLLVVVCGDWVRIYSDSRHFVCEVVAPAMPPRWDDLVESWVDLQVPRSHRDLLFPVFQVWQDVLRPAPPSEFVRRDFERELFRSIEEAGRIARGEEGRP